MSRDACVKLERYCRELKEALAATPVGDIAVEQAYEHVLAAIISLPGAPRDREIGELSMRFAEQRRFDDAGTLFKRLSTTHGDRRDFAARAHYFRALSLVDLGAPVEARHHLRHALAIDPTLDEARRALETIAPMELVVTSVDR